MSYHSHSNTPSVIQSPKATSPKYNLAGVENEINASRNRQGYLSTLFGRSTNGVANRYSMRRNNTMLSSIFSQRQD